MFRFRERGCLKSETITAIDDKLIEKLGSNRALEDLCECTQKFKVIALSLAYLRVVLEWSSTVHGPIPIVDGYALLLQLAGGYLVVLIVVRILATTGENNASDCTTETENVIENLRFC